MLSFYSHNQAGDHEVVSSTRGIYAIHGLYFCQLETFSPVHPFINLHFASLYQLIASIVCPRIETLKAEHHGGGDQITAAN